MPIPIVTGLFGLAGKLADRLIPDRAKAQDQAHERAMKQADATIEGERSRNYLTPRSLVMYSMAFAVIYGIVLQPFAKAFGLDLPTVDYAAPLKLLIGLLGLG